MKRFYFASIALLLAISCSKDDPINEIIEEEEEKTTINLAPNHE
ncbi:hypothetical protein [Jejuia spongiicola]|nr:hypothetical protein [Jejuia spongiicola]